MGVWQVRLGGVAGRLQLVPRPQGERAPREYVDARDGVDWTLAALVEDAPVSARYAQVFAQRLRECVRTCGMSINALGTNAELGVGRKSIERILAGEVLPTFSAIARLETYFGVDLWPGPQIRGDQ